MKRVQVNSKESRTNVLLSFPIIDSNKTYSLTVEKLMVPALDSLILNKTLFTVERRLALNTAYNVNNYSLPLDDSHTVFTPRNIRTVSQLVYQVNQFFRELTRRLVSEGLAVAAIHQFAIPANFVQQNADWYSGLIQPGSDIDNALMMLIRSDGKVGFRFSLDAIKLFVIHFTEEGKRIFNVGDFLALDGNGTFQTDYLTPAPVVINTALHANVNQDYDKIIDNSLFSHVSYRNELVLQSSLPLDSTVECDTDHSFYRRQLASYRFPSTDTRMSYNGMDRTLDETTQHMYTFENNIRTHNQFILKGTELQNFSLYLVNRNYEFVNGKYVQTEIPYDLHEDTFFTVQFAVRPL